MPSRTLLLLVAASAALSLAACGAGSQSASNVGGHGPEDHTAHESRHEPVDGAPNLTVQAVDIDFMPQRLELTAGEPANVTVVNDGQMLHDFTLDEADVHLNVEPGDQATTAVLIEEPGTYEARCTVAGHAAAGMVVEVVVTA